MKVISVVHMRWELDKVTSIEHTIKKLIPGRFSLTLGKSRDVDADDSVAVMIGNDEGVVDPYDGGVGVKTGGSRVGGPELCV